MNGLPYDLRINSKPEISFWRNMLPEDDTVRTIFISNLKPVRDHCHVLLVRFSESKQINFYSP